MYIETQTVCLSLHTHSSYQIFKRALFVYLYIHIRVNRYSSRLNYVHRNTNGLFISTYTFELTDIHVNHRMFSILNGLLCIVASFLLNIPLKLHVLVLDCGIISLKHPTYNICTCFRLRHHFT